MKITDESVTPDQRERVTQMYATHGELLRKFQKDAADQAQRYLLFINAGGALATLSFMGAKDTLRNNPDAWDVLFAFVAGVVLCGLVVAVNYHNLTAHFMGWHKDTGAAMAGQIDVEAPGQNLTRRYRRTGVIALALGWLAFAAFLTGLVLAYCRLRPH